MKYYIIAGEASGDLHASNLVRALRRRDPQAQFRACGGERLQEAGAVLVRHYRDMAFMGFAEVLAHLHTILSMMRFCVKDILAFAPDAVVLVDYPGFNLRVAKRLHRHGIPVYYYISPQVWAWHRSRLRQIREYVSEMLVILPFEEDFYAKNGLKVHYVGHPLLDEVSKFAGDDGFLHRNRFEGRSIVAVLPGSRTQEIRRMLPVMAGAARLFPDRLFVIAGIRHHEALYHPYLSENMQIVYGETYPLLAHSTAALVTSGTATLETALFGVPQVVCYKGNYFSYLIARHLIKGIRYISLVNLIADKPVVRELIQQDMDVNSVRSELSLLLQDDTARRMREDYLLLRRSLGYGNASERAAECIIGCLKKKNLNKCNKSDV